MKNNSPNKLFIKRLLALFSGGLVPFSFSPFDFYFLSFFSLAIIFYLWVKTKTARESFILGYIFGFAMFGIGVNWLHISIDLFGGVNIFFALFFTYTLIAFISLYPALVGYIATKYFKSSIFFILPILWVLSEWARGWVLTGFPWLNIGASQTNSNLSNFSPLIGDYGISFIVCIAAISVIKIFSPNKIEKIISLSLLIIIFMSSMLLNKVNWTENFDGDIGTVINPSLYLSSYFNIVNAESNRRLFAQVNDSAQNWHKGIGAAPYVMTSRLLRSKLSNSSLSNSIFNMVGTIIALFALSVATSFIHSTGSNCFWIINVLPPYIAAITA